LAVYLALAFAEFGLNVDQQIRSVLFFTVST
jgi:hypothetical protein